MEPAGAELSSGAGAPLPPQLGAARSTPMLGRAAELAAAGRALAAARVGAPQALLLEGEPGIGKTRTAAEAAAQAAAAGAAVLYGRCEEAPAPPHRPFAEALTAWTASAGPERARALLGDAAAPLAHLAPALGDDPPPGDRHSLYAAVGAGLARIAGDDGLLLVLDDLHCADEATVAIVRHLLRSPVRLPIAVLALHRSGARGGPYRVLLDELADRQGIERLALEGLSGDEAIALVARVASKPPDEATAGLGLRLCELTAGNPLYLTEVVRHLRETDRLGEALAAPAGDVLRGLPESLRGLALRRVDALGPDAAAILAAAALVGGAFSPATVRAATGRSEQEVTASLDAAARAGILRDAGGGEGGPLFAFVHSVIERALAEHVGAQERARLHAAIADALEADPGAGSDSAAALARHRIGALPDRPRAAVEATAAAGRVALARLAPHAASERFATALELLETWTPENAALRDELRIGLGEAQRKLGEPAFRETLLAAGRSARERGDDETLVRAVLANSRGFVSASGEVDRDRVELLEAALAVSPGDADRARLLALHASERTFDGDPDGRRRLASQAVSAARALGDPATTSTVLTLVFCPTSSPGTLEQRLEEMREAVALADRVGAPFAQFDALHWLGVALVQAGRFSEAVRTVDREAAVAERLGEPTALWLATYARAGLAAMFGHLEHAERLSGEALEHATASGQPDALAFYALQLAAIRFEQGRLGELQPLVAQAAEESRNLPTLRALLALALCEAELPAQAREVLAADAADGFARLPDDLTRLVGLTLYADVAARVTDVAAAETLAELLEPWAGQVAFAGIGGWGLVERALGRVLGVTGRLDDAERHLAAAAEQATRSGTQLWAARAHVDAAEVLLRRRGEGDRSRALELLDGARDAAHRLGAAGIERRARMLADRERAADALGRAGGPAPALVGLAQPARGRQPASTPAGGARRMGTLQRRGAIWRVSCDGRTVMVRHSRGMEHLARLLVQPGVEVPALELATDGAGRGADRGDPVLDAAGKHAFRRRVAELEEERDEAEAFNDPERAARAAEELDGLRAELARSLGLRGRDRRTSSAAERARLSVTRAIRRALERVEEQDAALGRELDTAVRTGTFCSYRPAPGRAIDWRLDDG